VGRALITLSATGGLHVKALTPNSTLKPYLPPSLLQNLINHTMDVLPPYFIEHWNIVNATGFVAGSTGNGALSLAPSFALLATIAASLLMLLGSML
jgi:hypothetical protein